MNQATFQNVVAAAKAKAAGHPEWLRAIEKAAAGLADGSLCVTLFADNTALVTSPRGSYRVNGTCPCAARTSHCYHRAAKRLVEMLDEAEPVATKAATRNELIAAIERAWPKDANLADELMRRFKVNSLSFLAEGWLVDILAAIA